MEQTIESLPTNTTLLMVVLLSGLVFFAIMYIRRLQLRLKKSELKIANAEAEWTQAMDSLDYPMYLVDLEDNLVRANKAFYKQINKPAEQCVGTDVRALIHLKAEDEPCPGCRARLERRDAFFTKEADDPHNALGRPIEVTIKVIRDEDGQPIGVVQSIRDVSHLRDTEKALRKSQALLNEAQKIGRMGNWEWNITSNEIKWSDETYRIFGFEPNAVVATFERFIGMIHSDDTDRVEEALKKALENKSVYQVEHRIILGSGEERVISERGQVSCNSEGAPIRMVGVCQDISEYHQAKKELELHKNNLEELVERRTVDLAKARDDAQQASRAKSAFLANMSHELRTPLNAIIGYSEIMLEDVKDIDEESLTKDLKKVLQSGKYLLTLISDILDLSKIEADKLELQSEKIDLKSLVESVVSTIDPTIRKNNNKFVADIPDDIGYMYGDLIRIRQSLLNLLSNAGKFTQNGVIELSIKSVNEHSSEWIQFSVSDTGIGISNEQIKNLFQPFSQGQASTTTNYGGTGLGLAITQRLCHMMGGNVSVSSIPNEGSKFIMCIPKNYGDSKANRSKEVA